MKNSSDIDNYNREFQDLQLQLKDMTAVKFNGVSLFAQYTTILPQVLKAYSIIYQEIIL